MSTYSSSVSSRNSQAVLNREPAKSYYQDDQQVKFMHLQAEVDSLLQQLQSLKQQKLTTSGVEE
ncbi:hypothetical protein [Calothrix sp. PCC 7507]|uniref:hypothetical protein n=1 Tax=Calothrix sp. PCC 7507 TaxID=99598 RepID=UPI00029EDD7C|nr:hypothetical protein [Calothrix sp. PCC 7507]AFY32007.1 hypothetical protein Cal7507_1547 [Calothrix sp. PCC 7507]